MTPNWGYPPPSGIQDGLGILGSALFSSCGMGLLFWLSWAPLGAATGFVLGRLGLSRVCFDLGGIFEPSTSQ